jgi:hypothetical protein
MIQSTVLKTEEDDLTGLSGWMYTDLLLGLVVIFLATITFVPNLNLLNREGISSGDSVYSYTRTIDKPLTLLIEDQQLPDIPALIDGFKTQQGIASTAEIVYVQVVGAYNDRMEAQSNAVERALRLSQLLDEEFPELFKNSATTFSTTSSVPSNQVVVRIIFAERILVTK